MNLTAHLLCLAKIQRKMDRGEELSTAEITYVRLLWKRIMERFRPIVARMESATGMSSGRLAEELKTVGDERRRRVLVKRDQARDAMMRMRFR